MIKILSAYSQNAQLKQHNQIAELCFQQAGNTKHFANSPL